MSVAKNRPEVQKISFVAHSLGGLVARYAIGRLFEDRKELDPSVASDHPSGEDRLGFSKKSLEQPCEGRIAGLQPMNFITFATPHLGSRGNNQVDVHACLYLLH